MLSAEAEYLGRYFSSRPGKTMGPVLNLGSSTGDFRARVQPVIDQLIFRPLAARGVPVVHADIKSDAGVDLVADILDEDGFARMQSVGARTILCSNVLEHVPERARFMARLADLTPPGGTLIVTVPSSYPYHPDPIDNRFRPTLAELRGCFPELDLVDGAVVSGPTLLQEFIAGPELLPRRLASSLMPFPRPGRWLSSLDRWRWLFRAYTAAYAVLVRPVAP